jgi:hypothetical protein
MNKENFNKSKRIAPEMRRLSMFIGILLLLSTFVPAISQRTVIAQQPGEKIASITSRTYYSVTSLVKRTYHAFLSILFRILSWLRSLYIRIRTFVGISPTAALTTVFKVLVMDFFTVLSKFAKGADVFTSLVVGLLLTVLLAINFIILNFVSLISLFLTNITILTPGCLVDYWHDFIFNFIEGFSDPWSTLIAIWSEIEYYQGIIGSISELGSTIGQTVQGTSPLSLLMSLLSGLINLIVEPIAGLLNAIMHTRLRR